VPICTAEILDRELAIPRVGVGEEVLEVVLNRVPGGADVGLVLVEVAFVVHLRTVAPAP
jgi:hypothetical protein